MPDQDMAEQSIMKNGLKKATFKKYSAVVLA